jgi:hypothetical protein
VATFPVRRVRSNIRNLIDIFAETSEAAPSSVPPFFSGAGNAGVPQAHPGSPQISHSPDAASNRPQLSPISIIGLLTIVFNNYFVQFTL